LSRTVNMGTNAIPASTPRRFRRPRTHEIAQTLLHIKGLVYARAILEDEGASPVELAEHSAELERQRRRLANLVRDFYAGDRDCRRTRPLASP
jgi:hypothetical protein